jgi:hypothetical protein
MVSNELPNTTVRSGVRRVLSANLRRMRIFDKDRARGRKRIPEKVYRASPFTQDNIAENPTRYLERLMGLS